MPELSLLVVDDEQDLAEFAAAMGRELGIASEFVLTSKQFMKRFVEMEPSVVIMDVFIPEKDALELIVWMGQQNHVAPIILTSGFDPLHMNTAKTLAGHHGIVVIETLVKPISEAMMKAILGKIQLDLQDKINT